MRRLNRVYRDKDKPTDVLSFPGDQNPDGRHLGDVVISVPTARRQADGFDHGVERELKTLVLHGMLHCLGYDHETDDGTMERLENELQRELFSNEPPAAGDGAPS
jgi:probable rRNA maturation factor